MYVPVTVVHNLYRYLEPYNWVRNRLMQVEKMPESHLVGNITENDKQKQTARLSIRVAVYMRVNRLEPFDEKKKKKTRVTPGGKWTENKGDEQTVTELPSH